MPPEKVNPTPDIKRLITEAKAAHRGPKFLGFPDAWYEPQHYWCKNGHLSSRYLRSEEKGCLCLACGETVMLGPKELPGVIPK